MIVDATMYFGGAHERWLIPLRIHELRDVVDRWLIVEGDESFQGAPHTPQFWQDYEQEAQADRQLLPQRGRIDYHVVCDWPSVPPSPLDGRPRVAHDSRGMPIPVNRTEAGLAAATREIHLRNSVTRYLDGYPGDTTVILSDFDEIPRAVSLPRRLAPGAFHRLGGPYYLYWLNLRIAGAYQWYGSRVVRLDELRRTTAETLRQQRGEGGIGGQPGDLVDGAWHFSFLGGAEAVRHKLTAWRHPEFNDPQFLGPDLDALTQAGKDWWPERGLALEWCELDGSYPAYVREHPERFTHLLGNRLQESSR